MIPIVTFSLESNLSQADLYHLLSRSRPQPDGPVFPRVRFCERRRADQVVVTLDRQKLLDSGLTYDEVTQALQANNVILPSGQLATGDTVLPLGRSPSTRAWTISATSASARRPPPARPQALCPLATSPRSPRRRPPKRRQPHRWAAGREHPGDQSEGR